MYSEAFNNLDSIPVTKINNSVKTSKKSLFNFENFTLVFSIVAPILSVVFLVLVIPLSVEFYSLNNYSEINQFNQVNQIQLVNLMYLLFASSIFSIIGLMIGLVHKKIIFITLNFLSLIVAGTMVIPMLIMIIGD
jgi:magnesium-transporting ATPase (P-type)